MKTPFLIFTILFWVVSLSGFSANPILKANYQVIPLPQNIIEKSGIGFDLNASTVIAYSKDNVKQKQIAECLAEYIKFSTGLSLKLTDNNSKTNAIVLQTGYKGEKPDSYQLTVNNKQITINGFDDAGLFYGVQTLRKSIPAFSEGATIQFPAVDIQDYPRFGYRGMMLDVARHMFPVAFIKKYIDIMALHNINRFHWHLTDDQGWRIEIKKYPELTKIGSMRDQTVIGRNTGKYDGKPYGGFYTQAEIKEIVAYAQKRFITIIPEVDLPGHMLAALATYPNLGCTGGPYKVSPEWGVFDDVLCAGNEETYTFLENVFTELIELFPSELIHIGGDESPKVRWKECPKCQAKITELGLTDDSLHTKEDKLQSYVMTRMEKFLNERGRHIIGWDEILEGGIAPNATIMSWRGLEGGITAAKQHHDVIMVPTSYLYFDYYQTRDVDNEPLGIGGYVPIERVYEFDPVPKELTPDEQKYIIGTQANLWTEYIATSDHVEYMVLPRMAALSEIQWTMPSKKNYELFLNRLAVLFSQYKKLGYNYATHVRDISSIVDVDDSKKALIVSLFTFDSAPIFYTLDGSEPSVNSFKYMKPIELKSSANIRAIVIRDEEKSRVFRSDFNFNKATLKDIKLLSEPHKNYTFKGGITLVDGKRGGGSFGDGEWLGFIGSDFDAVLDLGSPVEISKVTTGTFLGISSWIFGAKEYTVSISNDGVDFKPVFTMQYPEMKETDARDITMDLVAEFPLTKARYVKVTAKPLDKIPSWHLGKGRPAFIFIDEIMIE